MSGCKALGTQEHTVVPNSNVGRTGATVKGRAIVATLGVTNKELVCGAAPNATTPAPKKATLATTMSFEPKEYSDAEVGA